MRKGCSGELQELEQGPTIVREAVVVAFINERNWVNPSIIRSQQASIILSIIAIGASEIARASAVTPRGRGRPDSTSRIVRAMRRRTEGEAEIGSADDVSGATRLLCRIPALLKIGDCRPWLP